MGCAVGTEAANAQRHSGPVSIVTFSPDGSKVVSVSWDNTIKMWNAPSGQKGLTIKSHSGPESYGILQDG